MRRRIALGECRDLIDVGLQRLGLLGRVEVGVDLGEQLTQFGHVCTQPLPSAALARAVAAADRSTVVEEQPDVAVPDVREPPTDPFAIDRADGLGQRIRVLAQSRLEDRPLSIVRCPYCLHEEERVLTQNSAQRDTKTDRRRSVLRKRHHLRLVGSDGCPGRAMRHARGHKKQGAERA